ncbi:MAG: hypothetical protein ACI4YB_07310 [Oscillospiraceae bacterium]
MKSILRGQLYMLPRYVMSHLVFTALAFIQVLLTVFTISDTPELITSAGIFASVFGNTYPLTAVLYIFILTAQVCLYDFSDKTLYYEIMGGHTRSEVYFGRVIPCLVLGTLGSLVLLIIPDITATVMLGWGSDIPMSDIVIRRLLLIFPLLRLGCEFVFISFLAKNMVGAVIIGFGIFLGGSNLAMIKSTPWLGMTSISMLYETDIWTTYGLDSAINYSFEASIQADTIISVVVCSVVAAVISLVMGYQFFKSDDMN